MKRLLPVLAAIAAVPAVAPVLAQAPNTAFDLVGPSFKAGVTRDGRTLPIAQVPNLRAGDRLRVEAALPADQSARYLMVVAFLRGATNPPPEEWLPVAETWKAKGRVIDVAVPDGAEQALVFLVPDTGGAFRAVKQAVTGRPGAFVRASQELNQAHLDRMRLDAFLAGLKPPPGSPPERGRVARVSGPLARSLAVRFDEGCLARQPELQAACLTQGPGQQVLADGHSNSVADALTGAPTDLAYGISATPQGGLGYYSPYIGVVRDLARILGAFQSAQLQFIPALSVERGDRTELLLNTVPSFQKPQSVLVAALPPVTPAPLPPLVASGGPDAALCAARPGLLLPVEGAPLVFGSRYLREAALKVERGDGTTLIVPVRPDPERGGFAVAGDALERADLGGAATATLTGIWGFEPYEGPRFRLVSPAGRRWRVADGASLVVGRETPLELTGGAAPCVTDVSAQVAGAQRTVAWEVAGPESIRLRVPLADAEPGPVTLAVTGVGTNAGASTGASAVGGAPELVTAQAYEEVGRVAGLVIHAGDRSAVLTGTRLDQVAGVDLGGVALRPDGLERAGAGDRLKMTADSAGVGALRSGEVRVARVALANGRQSSLRVVVLPPRPVAQLAERRAERPATAGLALVAEDAGLVPADARLEIVLRAGSGTRFGGSVAAEVEGPDGQLARLPLSPRDADTAVARLDAGVMGADAAGPMRLRVLRDGVAGDWMPLGTLVRVPEVEAASCTAERCRVTGRRLGRLASVRTGPAARDRVAVREDFVGETLDVARAPDGRLLLEMRDAPGRAWRVEEARAAVVPTPVAGS